MTDFTIELFIVSEGGKISALDWESVDSVGTPFPGNCMCIFSKSKFSWDIWET